MRASRALLVSDSVLLWFAWVESGSKPCTYTIENVKCLFEKICHFVVCSCRGPISVVVPIRLLRFTGVNISLGANLAAFASFHS